MKTKEKNGKVGESSRNELPLTGGRAQPLRQVRAQSRPATLSLIKLSQLGWVRASNEMF